MEKIIQEIAKKARKGLLPLLVPALIGIGASGCSREAPKRSDSLITYTAVSYIGPLSMHDENCDGKIDALKNKERYIAIDTNVIKDNSKIYSGPTIMDSFMVELATKIANSQRELGFKIDSARYYGGMKEKN